jgi:carbamoyl-phosphate synthase large subunit
VKRVTVLVSSAGRRVALLDCFRRSAADLGVDGRMLAVDRSWYASAFHAADEAFLVPGCADPDFVPRVLELCERHAVDLVVPTIDPELPVYAAARSEFESVGTRVVVSSPETVGIAADKVETHRWLTASGFPTVDQAAWGESARGEHESWSYPLVVKPRHGSAAVGVAVVNDPAELEAEAARGDELVVQAVAPGIEYTIDVLVDGDGRGVCAVPRRRLEVRAGEVSKAVTVRSPRLEGLAIEIGEALPGAFGPITIQVFEDAGAARVIELNARFGGGFPLSHEAGAVFARWLMEERLGLPSTATNEKWRDGLVMLRYDAAVFVEAPGVEAPGADGGPA